MTDDRAQPPASIDVGDFCRQVEDHLTRVNGGHLVRVVGPGFELVRNWAEAGIPLSVVLRGIERRAERHRTKAARRPLRIEFCEGDVREVYDEWHRAVGLPRLTEPGDQSVVAESVEPRKRSLGRHLDRVIDKLGRMAGRLDLPDALRDAADAYLPELAVMREAARKAKGAARSEMTTRLATIDAEFTMLARASAPGALVDAICRDAEQDLAAFRSRLPPEMWRRSVEITIDRLLRDRFGVPAIEP